MHDTSQLHPTTSSTSTPQPISRPISTSSADVGAARYAAPRPVLSDRPHDRRRPEALFWAYLAVSGACAVLIPFAVFLAAPYIDDGLLSVLIAWLIAGLMGLAVYFSAVASDAAHRLR